MTKLLISLSLLFMPYLLTAQSGKVDSLLEKIIFFEQQQDTFQLTKALETLWLGYSDQNEREKGEPYRSRLCDLAWAYGLHVDDPFHFFYFNQNIPRAEIYFELKVLENVDSNLSFPEIKEQAFAPNNTYPRLNPDQVHWMKFKVHGPRDSSGVYRFMVNGVLRAWDEVDVFYEKEDSTVHLRTGFALLNREKNLRSAYNEFEIPLDQGEERMLYIRVVGKNPDFPARQLQVFFMPEPNKTDYQVYTFPGSFLGESSNVWGAQYNYISQYLNLMEAPSPSYTLEEAVQHFDQNAFQHISRHIDPDAIYWGRLKIAGTNTFYGNQLFSIGGTAWAKIDIFIPDGKGSWDSLKTGSSIPARKKYRKQALNLFELNIPPNDTINVFFRFEKKSRLFQNGRIRGQSNFRHLEPEVFWTNYRSDQLRSNRILGGLAIIILYFFLFHLIHPSRIKLYFTFLVLSLFLALLVLGSFLSPRLMIDWPWQSFWVIKILVYIALYFFSREYLNLNFLNKWFPRSFFILLGLEIIGLFIFSLNDTTVTPNGLRILFIENGVTLVMIIYFFLLGILSYRSGHRPAIFYLIAFSGFFLAMGAFSFGMILQDSSFMNNNLIDGGIIGIPVLFALGMGYRSRLQQQEHEKALVAQTQALATAEAAEAANEAKSSFLSTVSHELRTPLTSIIGFTKLNKKNLEEKVLPAIDTENPKAQKSANRISKNLDVVGSESNRLLHLINELLDLAKIESGKVDWKEEEIQPATLIERASQSTSALFAQKPQLELITEVPNNLPNFTGDPDRLLQVLLNLISNAVKFTDRGRVTLGVRTSTLADRNHGLDKTSQLLNRAQPAKLLNFFVSDTGSGIPADHLDKVFERFQQVDSAQDGKPKGTGLGLPICKEIVEHHGGDIWVESEEGKGSSFYFNLPMESRSVPGPS